MSEHFEKNWKEFIKGNMSENSPERMELYELARMFYAFGFSAGVTPYL